MKALYQPPIRARAGAASASPALDEGRAAPATPSLLPGWALWPLVALVAGAGALGWPGRAGAQPARLSDTGLYVTGSTTQTAPGVIAFEPRHALWSDGAQKRRWIKLPAGRAIDASKPDAWQFPPGTRLWKEFVHGGQAVETRTIERLPNGQWRFATYVWNADGRDAVLAAERGQVLDIAAAPQGRYEVPGRNDCLACHESNGTPVIGLSALQLAALPEWQRAGRLRGLPGALDAAWRREAPRVPGRDDVERQALGYLHANCGHCHNRGDRRVPLNLTLKLRAADAPASRAEVLASVLHAPSRLRGGLAASEPGTATHLVVPGAPAQSLLLQRMHTREPRLQMPPLGTRQPDLEGLALVERWITSVPLP